MKEGWRVVERAQPARPCLTASRRPLRIGSRDQIIIEQLSLFMYYYYALFMYYYYYYLMKEKKKEKDSHTQFEANMVLLSRF